MEQILMSRRKKCQCGKTRYLSRTSAMAAITRAKEWYGKDMRMYPCPNGPGFHLSSKKRR